MDYNKELIRGINFNKENLHTVCDSNGENIDARNFLLIPLRKNNSGDEVNFGEIYTAVMMNPSKATAYVSDQTVQVIIKRAYDRGFSYVLILNTIPFFLTDSDRLEEELSKISKDTYVKEMDDNMSIIRKFLSENNLTYILVATGAPRKNGATLVREAMLNVYRALAEFDDEDEIDFFRHALTVDGFCSHPQGKTVKSIVKFRISDLKILNEKS